MKILMSQTNAKMYSPRIEAMGYEVQTYSQEDLENKTYPTDANIITGAIDLVKMDEMEFENLRYIFLTSVGIDFLDLDYIEKAGIILTNARGAYDDPIAEWVLYSLLQIEKKDKLNLKIQEDRSFKRRLHSGVIYNKTALILGTGTIARETARRLKAFKARTIGYNTDGRNVEFFDKCVDKNHLFDELKEADYVIMALPETQMTYHFVNDEFLQKMKDGSVFINISRGKTVDEDALIKALESGKLRSAGLDVFEEEPLPKDSKLYDFPQVYLYPHISFSCEDMIERQFESVLYNLKALKEGRELKNEIDFKKGY